MLDGTIKTKNVYKNNAFIKFFLHYLKEGKMPRFNKKATRKTKLRTFI